MYTQWNGSDRDLILSFLRHWFNLVKETKPGPPTHGEECLTCWQNCDKCPCATHFIQMTMNVYMQTRNQELQMCTSLYKYGTH